MTVVYLTMRKNPFIEWFFDSLFREVGFNPHAVKVIVVDALADDPKRCEEVEAANHFSSFLHILPKPNAWHGESRLTTNDCFACANSLNTALCVAEDDFLVFVADLTVLLPGWYKAALEAEQRGGVTCGYYAKVYHLEIENGKLIRYLWHINGDDTRISKSSRMPTPCHGAWLYGPCYAAPLQTLLHVNGADEATNGIGYEDIIMGQRLQNVGVQFFYDRNLGVYEWEEGHYPPHNEAFKRTERELDSGEPANVYLHTWSQTATKSLGTPNLKSIRNQWQIDGTWPDPTPPHIFPDGKTLKPALFA